MNAESPIHSVHEAVAATEESEASAAEAFAAEWRFGRGFSDTELGDWLAKIAKRPVTTPQTSTALTSEAGYSHYGSEALVASEPPGRPLPDGPFVLARGVLERYEFSDPRIVVGHFDRRAPLLGRSMLLELKVLGLHYLCGVRVGAVREGHDERRTQFGYRYDTLAGHVEAGSEWFLLTKDHESGHVHLGIRAAWRPGEFPNWWSRVGFHLVSRHYQRAWHRLAHVRVRELLQMGGLPALPRDLVTYGRTSEAALQRLLGPELVHSGAPLTSPSLHATASGPQPSHLSIEQELPAH